jgi:predicted RND superfamily exporter protein
MAFVIRYRWLLLGLMLITVASVMKGVGPALVPNNSLSVWFLDEDPAVREYREFQQLFGNDEVVMLLIEFPDGVMNQTTFAKLRTLKSDIEAISGIHAVFDVSSLADRLSPQALEAFNNNSLIKSYYVDAQDKMTLLWVEMTVSETIDAERQQIIEQLKSYLTEQLPDNTYHLGGIGVMYNALNEVTEHDFGIFLSIGFMLLLITMGFVFRSTLFSITTLIILSMAILVMYGFYGMSGYQINMVTSVLPIIVLILGVTDIVHFPAAYQRMAKQFPALDSKALAHKTIADIFWPCLLTTLTTSIGFLALTNTSLSAVRELGLFAAIGIMAAFVNTLILMTFVYLFKSNSPSASQYKYIDRVLERTQTFVRNRLSTAWLIIIIVTALAFVGSSQVKVDTLTSDYLPKEHQSLVDHHAIESKWGAYNVLEFVIEPSAGYQITDVEIIDAIDEFVTRATELPEIHSGLSINTLYQEMANTNMPLDFSNRSTEGNPVAIFQSEDGKYGRLKLFGTMLSARELSDLLDELSMISEQVIGEMGTIAPSGYLPLYTKIIDYIIQAQVDSFTLALACIFLIILIGFKSLKYALIATIANLFPVLMMFSVMGFAQINLDIATASIAAIVLGIAIDDTIHFLWSWRRAELDGLSWHEAVEYTYAKVGRPVIISSVLLISGFAILMAGTGATVFYFGLLTCVAALAALFGDLLLLPMIMKLTHKEVRV